MANYSNNLGQIRLGWRTAVSTTPVNTNDVDATAFITAAGITDSTQISALNTLVNDLKTYGLWTKMKALYPFVGGSAASHKWNLKDPRDLDAAYRLAFNGGWVHSSNGAKPNGTNGYANTFLIPNINLTLNDVHLSYYSKTNILTTQQDMGAGDNRNSFPSLVLEVYRDFSSTQKGIFWSYNGGYGTDSSYGNSTNINSLGFYIGSRLTSNSSKFYKNSNVIGSNNNTSLGMQPLYSLWIGGQNYMNTLYAPSSRESGFTSIGDGLSDTEASNFYTSVQKFQTTLGRQVGTPYVSDPDAISFLMAAGITDGTQASAINTLVIRMKADGVWTKMKAIYPFVGGSATSHKWNLKDPRDLDAAYRLVFNGGWTHTGTGAKPNGTTGYADTKLSPSSDLSTNSGFGWYSITNNNTTSSEMGALYYDMPSVANVRSFQVARNNGTIYVGANSQDFQTFTDNDSRGFYQAYRTDSSTVKTLKNTTLYTATLQYYPMVPMYCYIGARNERYIPQVFSDKGLSFAYFQSNFTDSDATALYNAVQEFQTTLGRQTDVPLVSDTDAQAFLNAANITSFQQASAVNKLVVDLKAAGVWGKMKAIYPFVGGSAASHKFNLKDPRDLDLAYRLVFNGGWVHSSTGALPNGSNAYADTKLNESSVMTLGSQHISFYSRTNVQGLYIDMGIWGNTPAPGYPAGYGSQLLLRYTWPSTTDSFIGYSTDGDNNYISNNDSRGFFMSNRTSNSQLKLQKNSTINTFTSNAINKTNLNFYIGSRNIYNSTSYLYSPRESAFATIGDGLTDGEATALYTAVQTYQTSLGRAVDTPVYNNGLVLNLDAGNANSYPGTGTTWFDLASGNNGTLVNGPTYDTANGGSIVFDGVNDHVITNDTSFRFGNKFSISLWFYWDGLNKTNNSLFSKRMGSAGNYNQYAMGISNGDTQYGGTGKVLFFYARVDGSTGGNDPFDVSITYTLPTAGFYNACIVMDTNSQKLYVNGILVGSNSKNLSGKTYNIAGRELILGAARGENATDVIAYASTKIHRFSVYSYSLTDTEVISNFNSTRGRFGL